MRSISGEEFLAPGVVGREQVWLVMIGGHQVEQHHADGKRLVARHALPELLEAGEQESGVARFVEIGFVPPTVEIADPGQMRAEPAAIVIAPAQPLGRFGQQMLRKIMRAFLGAQVRLQHMLVANAF